MIDTLLPSVSPTRRNPIIALLAVLMSCLDRRLRLVVITIRWLNGELPSVKAARFEAELQRINTALANCGLADITDEFCDAADAITHMADHIRVLEQAWNQLGEPEDYADHADNVFEVTP